MIFNGFEYLLDDVESFLKVPLFLFLVSTMFVGLGVGGHGEGYSGGEGMGRNFQEGDQY